MSEYSCRTNTKDDVAPMINVLRRHRIKWINVKQEITISAGMSIDLNFDWYGPAKMAELYGAN